MYNYVGFLDWEPYAIWQPFVFVIDDDFRLGAAVVAIWEWSQTASGYTHVPVIVSGSIDRIDVANLPSPNTTYGILYDSYYPFDIIVGEDMTEITVTMYEKPKSDSNCHAISTFTLYNNYIGRTKAVNYNPVRLLPICRFYSPGLYKDELFMMIVPDDIYTGNDIIVYYMEDNTLYAWTCTMSITAQDGKTATVTFVDNIYQATMVLDMDDSGWNCTQWDVISDASSSDSDDFTDTFDPFNGGFDPTPSDFTTRKPSKKLVPAGRRKISRPEQATKHSLATFGTKHLNKSEAGLPARNEKRPQVHFSKRRSTSAIAQQQISFHALFTIDDITRTTSKVVNDTTLAILCTLEESGASTKAKMLAGLGMVLGALGIMPLGPFGTPVGVMGAMLAGVGLYDTLNEPTTPSRLLLFPDENMSRTGSGGLPFTDNNDLTILVVVIKDKNLRLRTAVIEKLGETTTYLSNVIDDDSLFTTLLSLSWTNFDDKVIQAAKLVKVNFLVPVYNEVKELDPLSNEVLYDINDGQMLLDNSGYEGLYGTLTDPPSSSPTTLFNFDIGKTTVLFHAYVEDSTRSYDVLRLPGSRVVVLKMTKCRVNIDDESNRNPLGAVAAESDAWGKIVLNGGYYAYSWRTTWDVCGYAISDLSQSSIDYTNDALDIVYIPIAGWLPWQSLVAK